LSLAEYRRYRKRVCVMIRRVGDSRRRIDLPSTIYSYALSAPPPAGRSVDTWRYVRNVFHVRVCVCVCVRVRARVKTSNIFVIQKTGKKITQIDKKKKKKERKTEKKTLRVIYRYIMCVCILFIFSKVSTVRTVYTTTVVYIYIPLLPLYYHYEYTVTTIPSLRLGYMYYTIYMSRLQREM